MCNTMKIESNYIFVSPFINTMKIMMYKHRFKVKRIHIDSFFLLGSEKPKKFEGKRKEKCLID